MLGKRAVGTSSVAILWPRPSQTCSPGWFRSEARSAHSEGGRPGNVYATIAETAVPTYEALQWFGILAPAGTPAPIVALLQAKIAEGLRAPEIKARLAADGAEAVATTPAEFAAWRGTASLFHCAEPYLGDSTISIWRPSMRG